MKRQYWQGQTWEDELTILETLGSRGLRFAHQGKFDLVERLALDLGVVRETLLGFAERLVLEGVSGLQGMEWER